jgi:hypothetical protein
MISICCTESKPEYKTLSHDEYQKFCRLVNILRKKGYQLEEAQDRAYHQVLEESIPFEVQARPFPMIANNLPSTSNEVCH